MQAGLLSHFEAVAGAAFVDPAFVPEGTFELLGQLGMELAKNVADDELDVRFRDRPGARMAREEHFEEQIEYIENFTPDGQISRVDEVYAGIALVCVGDLVDQFFDLLIGQIRFSHRSNLLTFPRSSRSLGALPPRPLDFSAPEYNEIRPFDKLTSFYSYREGRYYTPLFESGAKENREKPGISANPGDKRVP